jgi:CRISPR-associated endonuclease/helicase Cas3
LEEIAARDEKREPDKRLSAWVIDPDGSIRVFPLARLVEKDKQNKPLVPLGGRTVLLPPQAGGFSAGLLKGDEPFAQAIEYDVSDHWYVDKEKTIRRRWRGKSDDAEYEKETKQMRLIRPIYIPAPGGDEDAEGWEWLWFTRPKSADDDGSKTAQEPVTWDDHTKQVTENATRIASALKLPDELQQALVLAARFHDLGKKRIVWQRSIGNPNPTDWYAKSGKGWKPREITDYRHEFGSLLDLQREAEFNNLKDKPELQDLILHLIAVHHGYGRPHFPEDRAFDPEPPKGVNADETAAEVPRRFARLQRKYGRWGLAYLESLLRAADWAASAKPSSFADGEKK